MERTNTVSILKIDLYRFDWFARNRTALRTCGMSPRGKACVIPFLLSFAGWQLARRLKEKKMIRKNKTGVSTLASQKRPGSPPPELLTDKGSSAQKN
jgi:hypothetical protein